MNEWSSNAEVASQAPINAKATKDGMKLKTLTDSVYQIFKKKFRAAADQAMAIMRNINQQQKTERKKTKKGFKSHLRVGIEELEVSNHPAILALW